MKEKIYNIFKTVQLILTAILSIVTVIWDNVDIDMSDVAKDKVLHIIQLATGILIIISAVIWVLIPFIIKHWRVIKYKAKYGIDITKIDEFYEAKKNDTLGKIVDDVENSTTDKALKDLIKEVKKEGVIT